MPTPAKRPAKRAGKGSRSSSSSGSRSSGGQIKLHLSEFGYKDVRHLSAEKRHQALRKALRVLKKTLTPEGLRKSLQYRANLLKNTSPATSLLIARDAHWVQRTYLKKKKSPSARSSSSSRSSK